ncbi:MAG: TRAP transporter substrate-binding protein [Silicimonas sp.]
MKLTTIAQNLALALAMAPGALMAQTNLDFPLTWPDGNFHTENAKRFAEEVATATDGEVTITIHSGGSLGFKGPEMLQVVEDGLAPIGDMLANQQVGTEPLLGMESVPFLISDFDQLATFHDSWLPAVEEVLERHNQALLYVVPWPQSNVFAKVDATSIEDFAGTKIRTYDKNATELFNSIGMTSVQLPWGEVVPSLAAGTIDAVTTSASSAVDGKFWEFLDYLYETNHLFASNIVTINLDTWNNLSKENQAAIEEVAARLQPEFWEVSLAEHDEKAAVLVENGIEVRALTPEMREAMKDATAHMVQDTIDAVGDPASDIIDSYLAKIAQ